MGAPQPRGTCPSVSGIAPGWSWLVVAVHSAGGAVASGGCAGTAVGSRSDGLGPQSLALRTRGAVKGTCVRYSPTMSECRSNRGLPPRSDRQILDHVDDVELLRAIGRGEVVVEPANRMVLRRLAREELCLAGFGTGVVVTLLPRGQRIVAAARGELAAPFDE